MGTSSATLIRGSGVDTEKFNATPLPGGRKVIMFAARYLRHKGIVEFIQAARILKEALGAEVRFVLVGGPDSDNPASVSGADVQSWVSEGLVEDWGKQKNMSECLASAHIVCLPSYREGLPKVLLEAMACGRPIITTDAPGCREVVEHGVNGLIAPVGDAAALARAMQEIVANDQLAAHMAASSRSMAVTQFSSTLVGCAFGALYARSSAISG
jgi:glycosyltransferase involved in cell wall biosynthesis